MLLPHRSLLVSVIWIISDRFTLGAALDDNSDEFNSEVDIKGGNTDQNPLRATPDRSNSDLGASPDLSKSAVSVSSSPGEKTYKLDLPRISLINSKTDPQTVSTNSRCLEKPFDAGGTCHRKPRTTWTYFRGMCFQFRSARCPSRSVGPSRNRFLSLSSCEKQCLPLNCHDPPLATDHPCVGFPESAAENMFSFVWTFVNGSCTVIPYRGCRNTANLFVSKEQCREMCGEGEEDVQADQEVVTSDEDGIDIFLDKDF